MNKNFANFLLPKENTIRHAMKKLDETAVKVLYIVDECNKLLGALSDGDIRRGILRGVGLDELAETVMNKKPKYIKEVDFLNRKKSRKMMLDYELQSLPVLNEDEVVIDILLWVDLFNENKKEAYNKKRNKVFILAGGIGSRLEPFTKILPKPLVPLGEQPIIERIMDKFSYYGFGEFILSTNYKAEMIKMYFNDPEVRSKYENIDFIKEDMPLGTIGSLYLVKDQIEETIFITNSDILVEEDMEKILNFHKDSKNILTIVGCVKDSIIPYGVLNTDDRGNLLNIEEKPKYKHVINTGLYVAQPEIIDFLEPNKRADITELIELLLMKGKSIGVYPVFEEQWFDIGQWAEYEKTRKYFEK